MAAYTQFDHLALPVIEEALAHAKEFYGYVPYPGGDAAKFLDAYRKANGNPEKLPREWQVVRAGLVRRKRGTGGWLPAHRGNVALDFDRPDATSFMLITLAYSDAPNMIVEWLEDEEALKVESREKSEATP